MRLPGGPPRRAEPGDLDGVRACLEAGFAARYTPARRDALGAILGGGRSHVVDDGSLVAGAIVAHDVEITLPGLDPAPAACLSDAAVRPTHRRRGVLSALMGSVLADTRERGEAIAVLGASEAGIYARFGWGAATATATYLVDRGKARALGGARASSGAVELLDVAEAAEAFPAVFDAARRRRPGEISRRRDAWRELLGSETAGDGDLPRFLAAYAAGPDVDGYAIYEVRAAAAAFGAGERREVAVLECCALTDTAYAALFAYLLGIDLTDAVRTGERPVDEPLRHLLDEPRALRTVDTCDGAWLRLVDARAALERRGYGAPGRVVVDLRDELCPWNAAHWSVEVDRTGAVEVARAGSRPELALDASELATLYLGGTRATSLQRAGRVAELEPGAARRLDAMLYCDPVPFCTAI